MPLPFLDPPAPATGTLLILDTNSLGSGRFYSVHGDRHSPTFSIHSDNPDKHRSIHLGTQGPTVGEVTFHTFKSGKGTVTIGSAAPVKIEDWMQHGNAVDIGGQVYEWSGYSYGSGDMDGSLYEAHCQKEVVATYKTSNRDANGVTRAHIIFADGADINKVAPALLLSLIIYEHFGPDTGKGATGDKVGVAIAGAISVVLGGGGHV